MKFIKLSNKHLVLWIRLWRTFLKLGSIQKSQINKRKVRKRWMRKIKQLMIRTRYFHQMLKYLIQLKIKMKFNKNKKLNKMKHKSQNQNQFYLSINKVILKKSKKMNYFMFKLCSGRLLILWKKLLLIIKREFKRLNSKRKKLMMLKSF